MPEQHKGIVLLLNADHFLMQIYGPEIGMGAAKLLAGLRPDPSRLSIIIPWASRGLLLIPALQLVGVASTMRRVRHWRHQPNSRLSRGRMWALHIVLPSIPNLLLAAVPISLLRSRSRGFLFLFAPVLSWLALICGGFAAIWTLLRTRLVLLSLRRD